jgi:hypothetical protein
MNLRALALSILIPIIMISISNNPLVTKHIQVYGQSASNDSSSSNTSLGSQFIVNIRGISSFTEPNMVVILSTGNDVQAEKVDLDDAVIESGQENSFSPLKMVDVTVVMNTKVKANSEVTACVLQLGSGTFSQRINCNTVFSVDGNTGEPQKIIVPL